ncbi:MAG: TonB-dependent receptor [Pseudomonadota bacterium]
MTIVKGKTALRVALCAGFALLHTVATADDGLDVDELVIYGGEAASEDEQSGLNVDVIDAEDYANQSTDLTYVMRKTPGVIVREQGGMGSDFDLSLNGLGGRQIRYFIDGLPMENFGSALSLNNFPINLIEQIQIYKGVVPITYGADALGGAVNITTRDALEPYLDASLSYGSYNTLRAAINAQSVDENGGFARVTGFINRSDNDYPVDNVPTTDALGNQTGTATARRFNDQYQSAMLSLRRGVTDRGNLRELSFGLTAAANRDEEQHPDQSINDVYGRVYEDNETLIGSATWRHRFGTLDTSASVQAGRIVETSYDAFSRNYDWFGNFVPNTDPLEGEIDTLSIFERDDEIARLSLTAERPLSERNTIAGNVTFNRLDRSGNDRLNANNTSFTFPNWVNKGVLGLSWTHLSADERFQSSLFSKFYNYDAEINAEIFIDFELEQVRRRVDKNTEGFGGSLRYDIGDNTTLSASYENSWRLPEPDEILGSGKYIRPNPFLEPEQSDNLNLGVAHATYWGDTDIDLGANAFAREATDFIRYVPDQLIFGIYQNVGRVRSRGLELSATAQFPSDWSLRGNLTWQDITDQTPFDPDGQPNLNVGSRLPNQPWLFGNLALSLDDQPFRNGRWSATWFVNYTHEFYLTWENSGAIDSKFTIPEQLTHDLEFEYTRAAGDLTVALSLRNLLDEPAFDNFNIQKPGRTVALKLRYSR